MNNYERAFFILVLFSKSVNLVGAQIDLNVFEKIHG